MPNLQERRDKLIADIQRVEAVKQRALSSADDATMQILIMRGALGVVEELLKESDGHA